MSNAPLILKHFTMRIAIIFHRLFIVWVRTITFVFPNLRTSRSSPFSGTTDSPRREAEGGGVL